MITILVILSINALYVMSKDNKHRLVKRILMINK